MTNPETKLVEALRKIVSEYEDMTQEPHGAGINAQFLAGIAKRALDASQSSGQTIPAREEDGEFLKFLKSMRKEVIEKTIIGDSDGGVFVRYSCSKEQYMDALSRPHASHPEQANGKLPSDAEWGEFLSEMKKLRASIQETLEKYRPEQANATESVTITDEMVEAAAKAIWNVSRELEHDGPTEEKWLEATEDWRSNMREHARAALTAALTVKGEKK